MKHKRYDLPVDYTRLHFTERKIVREQYIEEQQGKCQYCGNDLSGTPHRNVLSKRINTALFPNTFFKYPVHLHHCHKTGMTIGAVHSVCNAVLWQYHGE
jgi:hypothetical protein